MVSRGDYELIKILERRGSAADCGATPGGRVSKTGDYMNGARGVPSRRTVLRAGLAAMAIGAGGSSVVLTSATRAAADVVNAGLFVDNGVRVMIDGLVVP